MMKKNRFYIITAFILVASFLICIANNELAYAAIKKGDTLGGLKKQRDALIAEQKKQNAQKARTKAEIEASKTKKLQAENELFQTKEDIQKLEENIAATNVQITSEKEKTNDLLRLYQQLQSENVYLSYITGASSMTDLIMRMDAINQFADYNERELNKLEMLQESNNSLNKELEKYQTKLDSQIKSYADSIVVLNDNLEELEEGEVTIAQEIKELIKYYESIPCRDDQDLIECVEIANNTGWLKPVTKGRITSGFGGRNRPTPTASSNHKGIDIGVSEGTPVYPTAAGQVAAIVRKSSCGGNMLYIWTNVNGKPYTYVYMHLKSIEVSVGEKVAVTDIVAYSGGRFYGYDRCTTGPHLHYGLSEGHHFGAPGDLALSKFNAYVIEPPGYPKVGGYFSGRS